MLSISVSLLVTQPQIMMKSQKVKGFASTLVFQCAYYTNNQSKQITKVGVFVVMSANNLNIRYLIMTTIEYLMKRQALLEAVLFRTVNALDKVPSVYSSSILQSVYEELFMLEEEFNKTGGRLQND